MPEAGAFARAAVLAGSGGTCRAGRARDDSIARLAGLSWDCACKGGAPRPAAEPPLPRGAIGGSRAKLGPCSGYGADLRGGVGPPAALCVYPALGSSAASLIEPGNARCGSPRRPKAISAKAGDCWRIAVLSAISSRPEKGVMERESGPQSRVRGVLVCEIVRRRLTELGRQAFAPSHSGQAFSYGT